MRICRESLLTKAHGRSCCGRKGASAPFSCLPARTGSGRARKQVKGLVPCGFSGQRPEPSESFLMSRSAIFKVLLSLFFSARFFIDHLTLPFSSYLIVYHIFGKKVKKIHFSVHFSFYTSRFCFSTIFTPFFSTCKTVHLMWIKLWITFFFSSFLSPVYWYLSFSFS